MVGPVMLQKKPLWLDALLREKFFTPCKLHSISKKNDRNTFCMDCSLSICQHCGPCHSSHGLLQIRRYVYHDVVRMQEMHKLIDCGHVQPYIINSAKVVFLNERPQLKPSKGLANSCKNCDRGLQDAYKFCSVSCKVEYVIKQGKDLHEILREHDRDRNHVLFPASLDCLPSNAYGPAESMTITTKAPSITTTTITEDDYVDDEEQLSPNSVLDCPSSCSLASSASTNNEILTWRTIISTLGKSRTTRITKRLGLGEPERLSSINRRKGTPNRSPSF